LANKEDSGRVQARKVFVALRDGLDQAPLLRRHQLVLDAVLDLLAEPDVGARVAARDRLDAMLADPPLVTRPHDWPHDQ
jgi:hypothetical protein